MEKIGITIILVNIEISIIQRIILDYFFDCENKNKKKLFIISLHQKN